MNKEKAICLMVAAFLAWSVAKQALYDSGLESPSTPKAADKYPAELDARAKEAALTLRPVDDFWGMGARNPFEPVGGYPQPPANSETDDTDRDTEEDQDEGEETVVDGAIEENTVSELDPPDAQGADRGQGGSQKERDEEPADEEDSRPALDRYTMPVNLKGIVQVLGTQRDPVVVLEENASKRYVKLNKGDRLLGLTVVEVGSTSVTVENQHGRRFRFEDYRRQRYDCSPLRD